MIKYFSWCLVIWQFLWVSYTVDIAANRIEYVELCIELEIIATTAILDLLLVDWQARATLSHKQLDNIFDSCVVVPHFLFHFLDGDPVNQMQVQNVDPAPVAHLIAIWLLDAFLEI